MSKQWFALQVHGGREKWIATYLKEHGFEQLLLLRQERRKRSDRFKIIDRPVFAGYIFCHLDLEQRSKVLAAPGVMRIVGYGKDPAPVADEEIAALKIIKLASCQMEEWPYLREGDRVRLEGGSLDGLSGHFVRTQAGHRVVVSVSILHRSVAVEIDRERLTVITEAENPPLWRKEVSTSLGSAQQSGTNYLVSYKSA